MTLSVQIKFPEAVNWCRGLKSNSISLHKLNLSCEPNFDLVGYLILHRIYSSQCYESCTIAEGKIVKGLIEIHCA